MERKKNARSLRSAGPVGLQARAEPCVPCGYEGPGAHHWLGVGLPAPGGSQSTLIEISLFSLTPGKATTCLSQDLSPHLFRWGFLCLLHRKTLPVCNFQSSYCYFLWSKAALLISFAYYYLFTFLSRGEFDHRDIRPHQCPITYFLLPSLVFVMASTKNT